MGIGVHPDSPEWATRDAPGGLPRARADGKQPVSLPCPRSWAGRAEIHPNPIVRTVERHLLPSTGLRYR